MEHNNQETLKDMLDDITSLAISVGRNEMSWRQECRDNATIDSILLSEKKQELIQWLYTLSNIAHGESGEGEV